jgi:hypothetical protein
VQERGGDRLRIQLEIREDGGDLHRVVHVVLAGQAALAGVRTGRTLIRPLDDLPIPGLEVVGDP